MKTHNKGQLLLVGAVALGMFAVMAASPASADPRESDGHSADRGYNAIPDKVPGNVPSVGFEATATNEFGDEVGLGGRARTLDSMSVVMSSWGCSESGTWYTTDCVTDHKATFDVPLTFTIYADIDGVRGDVLATRTKTVAVQYRPSASPKCTDNDVPNGKWYSKKDHTCYNGFAQTVEMNLPDVTLPDQVIWTVKYNTTHYGEVPIGQSTDCYGTSNGCGYDSLNVGVESFPNAPFAGTDLNENQVFRNGVMETGPANDPWTGFRPLGAITTQSRGDHHEHGDHDAR